jgi:hypothetical protein
VVLHHVAQRARVVVETRAAAHAHRLGHGDLHAADVGATPEWLEDGVAEAQHHQVLHRLLAQVVVDAVDLALGEVAGHFVVDGARRGQVVAQRFFEHHARVGVDQALRGQFGADGREQVGRGREVINTLGRARAAGAQRGETLGPGRVHGGEVQPRQKTAPGGWIVGVVGNERAGTLGDEGRVVRRGPGLAAHAHDARLGRQSAVQVGHVERGDQLAQRQVAGAAEDDEVQGQGGGGGGHSVFRSRGRPHLGMGGASCQVLARATTS